MNDKTSNTKTAKNIIKKHGVTGLAKLVEMFLNNSPDSSVATEFSVTRQRVHQWKNALGTRTVTFATHPEIEQLLGLHSGSRTIL